MPAFSQPTSVGHPAPAHPFHRMGWAHPSHRWWRPLTTALTSLMVYCALMLVTAAVFLFVGAFVPAVSTAIDQAVNADADLGDPVQLAFLAVTISLLWPAAALGVRWGGGRPSGTLSSVSGRLRWTLFPRLLTLAAVLFLVTSAVNLLLPDVAGSSAGVPSAGSGSGDTWFLLVVVLVAVPFQAAAEEYAFRGLLMQLIGSWLRHPAFAILLPVPLFVLGHGYGIVGQIDIALFAVAAGWITWRTGGLEAAIALHVVNNVGVFGFAAAGFGDPNATELPVTELPLSLVFLLAYSLIVVRWFPHPPPSLPPAPVCYLASA